ncbi:MAG: tetratricopeptide repeat protein [Phycisphaerales bacterium]|nr:tetratricopeptide repeat protein [Phycisphaerales bacterium]
MFVSWPISPRIVQAAAFVAVLVCSAITARAQNAAAESFNTANGLLARGLYEMAATEYASFLKANPRHEHANDARYGLAVCLFREQKFAEALQQLVEIDSRGGFAFIAETLAMKGQCQLAVGQFEQAAACFEAIIRDHSAHDLADDAGALLCETLYRQSKHKEVGAACEAFVQRWPKSPLRERADLIRGLSEVAAGDSAAAAKRLAEWLAAYPQSGDQDRVLLALAQAEHAAGRGDAAAHYRAVIEHSSSPFVAEASLGLAALLREQGRREDATKLLNSLNGKQLSADSLAGAQLQRARMLFDDGKFADAQRMFESLASANNAGAVEAGYWAAKCALRLGKAEDAFTRLQPLIDGNPPPRLAAGMRYDALVALVRLGRTADAQRGLTAFQRDFAKHELAVDALYLSAVLAHQAKDYDASRATCIAFLERAGEQHASAGDAKFLLAESDYLAGRLAEALAEFDRFEREHPNDEQTRDAAVRIGLILYRQNKLDEAARRLEPLAATTGQDAALRPVLQALGGIALARGEWKAAERHLRRVVEADPVGAGADDAWLRLGIACERQERYADAQVAFDTVIDKFPQTVHRLQAVFERGQCLLMENKPEPAKSAFELVIREGKDARLVGPAHEHLAAIATRSKDYTAAARHYQMAADSGDTASGSDALLRQGEALVAAGQYAEAQRALASFLSNQPSAEQRSVAQANLAIALARQNRADDALNAIRALGQRDLDSLTAPLRSAVRHDQAWCLQSLGRNEEAADVLRAALAEPDGARDWHALLALAEIDASADRREAAIQSLRKIELAAREPNAAFPREIVEPALYRLGICQHQLEQFGPAAATLDLLLSSFAGSRLAASAAYFSGESHMRAGAIDKAAERFSYVAEQHPDDAACAASLLRLGEALAILQRWPASEKAFRDYLRRFESTPHAAQARFGAAWALENMGRHDAALAAYGEVIAVNKGPTAARAQFQIGECLFALKKYEDAVREFLKVDILYAYPEWSAAALYEAGRCFDQLNKSGEARKSYQTVVEKFKDTRWASMAAERLNQLTAGGVPGRAAGGK